MNKKLLQGMTALLVMLQAGSVQAEKVYRWTDSNGNVHYGSKPGNKSAKRINIRNNNPAPAGRSNDHDRLQKQRRLLYSWEKERQLRQQREAQLQQEENKRQARCQYFTRLLQNYARSSYLYDKNPDGTRRIYSKQERRAAETKALASKEYWCRQRSHR